MRARGAKSRSTMRWPCSCRMRLSAKPPVMASRTLPMSAPPLAHSSSDSATAPMVMPTIIWLAILVSWPVPCGPTCVARPNAWNTGAARSKSTGLPPTMMTSVPFSAPTVPPDTGASRQAIPSSPSRAAWSLVRLDRGHVDEEAARRHRACHALGEQHVVHDGPALEHAHDDLGGPDCFSRRVADAGAVRGKRLGLGSRAVPDADLMAGLAQPARHRQAHAAGAQQGALHGRSSIVGADDGPARRTMPVTRLSTAAARTALPSAGAAETRACRCPWRRRTSRGSGPCAPAAPP